MPTILLVDDDPLDASILKSALEKRFRHVERVADPVEAFSMVEQPQFAGGVSLVIANLHWPGLDGSGFLAEMNARFPGVPVLVLGGQRGLPRNDGDAAVRFLSRHAAPEEMLIAATQMIGFEHLSPRIH